MFLSINKQIFLKKKNILELILFFYNLEKLGRYLPAEINRQTDNKVML